MSHFDPDDVPDELRGVRWDRPPQDRSGFPLWVRLVAVVLVVSLVFLFGISAF